MSSLAKSMASFTIHQDDENAGSLLPPIKALTKKTSPSGSAPFQRTVFATISCNSLSSENNSEYSLKSISSSNCTLSKNSAFENENDVTVRENQFTRSPLKDISKTDDANSENPIIQDLSPMSIDVLSPKTSEDSNSSTEFLLSCQTYANDIYQYLRKIETQFRPKAYYMKRQPDVTYTMRTILVDWLVEVCEEYKLHNETLYMAVSFIDRFLSSMAVVRAKLQLLGTSAMFIASKFEEVYPLEVSEFTFITDDTYTKKQVLRMEHLILKVLSFNLSSPTAYTFIMHICAKVRLPRRTICLAMYICELTLLEADPYLEFNPSLVAAASIALARHCSGFADVWSIKLMETTDYTFKSLAPVMVHLNETHAKSFTSVQVAIRDKYKSAKLLQVALIPHKKLIIRDGNFST